MTGLGVVKNGLDFNWTEQAVSLLKVRWAAGKSASEIASELRAGLSRSAVIGKAHRLGLSGRRTGYSVSVAPRSNLKVREPLIRAPKVTRPREAPAQDRGLKARIVARKVADDDGGFEVLPIPDQAADRLIPVAQRKTLFELDSTTCRWPVGDPRDSDFFFCGGKSSSDGGPYCNGHARASVSHRGR